MEIILMNSPLTPRTSIPSVLTNTFLEKRPKAIRSTSEKIPVTILRIEFFFLILSPELSLKQIIEKFTKFEK
jgi:hypothetical protein